MKRLFTTCIVCLTSLFVQAQLQAFHEDGKYVYGLKDSAGKIVVEPKYDYHEFIGDGLIKLRYENNWTLFDSTGKEINQYDRIYDFAYVSDLGCECARVDKNNKSGYIDKYGKEIIQPIYTIGYFSEGLAVVVAAHHFGYINTHGNLVIDTILNYMSAGNFKNGMAEVYVFGALYDPVGNILSDVAKIFGYIDRTGKEVVPLKYQPAQGYFKDPGNRLYISKGGAQQAYAGFKPALQSVAVFGGENNKFGFRKQKFTEEYGMYKVTDTILIAAKYDAVDQKVYDDLGNEIWKSGYFLVDIAGKKGLVDSLGKEITPARYDWIDYGACGNDYVKVKLNGKTGLIDQSGKEVILPAYFDVGTFCEGLAWMQPEQGGHFGYIDLKGRLVIDTILDYAGVHHFSDGLAMVERNGFIDVNGNSYSLFGYIDKTGKEAIPLKYTSAQDFKNGKAKVRLLMKEGKSEGHSIEMYIGKNGEEVK